MKQYLVSVLVAGILALAAALPQFTYNPNVPIPGVQTYPPGPPVPSQQQQQLHTFGLAPLLPYLAPFWNSLFRPPTAYPQAGPFGAFAPQQSQLMPFPQQTAPSFPTMPVAAPMPLSESIQADSPNSKITSAASAPVPEFKLPTAPADAGKNDDKKIVPAEETTA